jgi:hypothetical protein
MRFALTILIWLVMVGGLAFYIAQRDRRPPAEVRAATQEAAPMENFTLEITPTFATAADPYTLHGDHAAAATLVVRLGERELYRSDQPLPAGVAVAVHPVAGLVVGRNELYLRASPPISEALLDHAVRVRLLQGSRVVLDETLWGKSGASVAGAIPFNLTGTAEAGHDH